MKDLAVTLVTLVTFLRRKRRQPYEGSPSLAPGAEGQDLGCVLSYTSINFSNDTCV
jgi:hypothetical protein